MAYTYPQIQIHKPSPPPVNGFWQPTPRPANIQQGGQPPAGGGAVGKLGNAALGAAVAKGATAAKAALSGSAPSTPVILNGTPPAGVGNLGIDGVLNAGGQAGGVAAGAYTGYQQLQGLANAVDGKDMSAMEQTALALPTFGASFAYNPIKKAFGSGKSGDQKHRDSLRGGFFNPIFNNRSGGIIGTAGGGEVKVGDHVPNSYEADLNDSVVQSLVGYTNPIAEIGSYAQRGKNDNKQQKSTEWMAAEMANAAVLSDDPKATIKQFVERLGMNRNSMYQAVSELADEGIIDGDEADAYHAAIDDLYGVEEGTAQDVNTPQFFSQMGTGRASYEDQVLSLMGAQPGTSPAAMLQSKIGSRY